jgi:hypothetical protein
MGRDPPTLGLLIRIKEYEQDGLDNATLTTEVYYHLLSEMQILFF